MGVRDDGCPNGDFDEVSTIKRTSNLFPGHDASSSMPRFILFRPEMLVSGFRGPYDRRVIDRVPTRDYAHDPGD